MSEEIAVVMLADRPIGYVRVRPTGEIMDRRIHGAITDVARNPVEGMRDGCGCGHAAVACTLMTKESGLEKRVRTCPTCRLILE
ncbi:MAG TPA: hypothetical protein VMJ72_00610 [Candidatus Paceibacterota bacterium]|nr:hypothetical protein [Candidatus Paceibacterota bacterium]